MSAGVDESSQPTTVSLLRMPPWYRTLFWVDAMERFGFYGMQAILVLFASASVADGGLGMSLADAAALFGIWISLMFLLSLLGGWLGDRVLGQRRAMLVGCLVGATGYAFLAAAPGWPTAVGLVAAAAGGAIFKPNQQAVVNTMFGERRSRESGISLMYFGTQLSSLVAPLATGFVGEVINWRLGFALGAVMLLAAGGWLALASKQFSALRNGPGRPLSPAQRRAVVRRGALALAGLALVLIALGLAGALNPAVALALVGLCSLVLTILGYLWLYRNPGLSGGDRRRLKAFLTVFIGSAVFWMVVAQSGSVLTAFARDHTDRVILGYLVPASWMQAANPLFLLFLAPLAAAFLPRFAQRNPLASRMSTGLFLVGGGFLTMSLAAALAADGSLVSPFWLLFCHLVFACGELIVAAATIAAAADVLRPEYLGNLMGVYWLFAALGGGIGGAFLARVSTSVPLQNYFAVVGTAVAVVGVLFVLGRRWLTRQLAHDIAQPAPDGAATALRREPTGSGG